MDNIIDKNDTGQNNISQEPEWPAGLDNEGHPLPDPRLVEKLVEELKSQGKFDQIRNDCFAEVDTQPAYQNLRSRVTETVQRFLGRQRWNPNLNKNQLRNQLKQHIQQTPFMEDGVERIVEQVVNPKIMSVIQPEVESLICSWFDVERPEGSNKAENENGNPGEMSSSSIANDDFSREEIKEGSSKSTSKILEERRKSGANMSEKLSNVSSEDIAMRSADSDDDLRGGKSKSNTFLDRPISDTSSPGPGLRGDISPLTPERDIKPENIMRPKEDDISSNVPTGFLPSAPIDVPERSTTPQLKGNVSPLTPPPLAVRPVSPRTPPLPPYFAKNEDLDKTAVPPSIPLPPPPGEEDVLLQEEIVPMSNVSGQMFKSYTEKSTVSNTEKSINIGHENTHLETSQSSYHSTPPVPPNLPSDEPPLPPEMETRAEHTPPPPPPDSSFSKPASPLTSPIGSSPDDMEEPIRETSGYSSHSVMASDLRTPRQMQSQYNRATISDPAVNYNQGETQSSVSASDISDTDLPEASGTMSEDNEHENAPMSMKNQPEDDLEALEKAKADLQAQLAATTIDESNVPMEDSDGEVHTDDSSDYMKRFREIASGSKLQTKTDDDCSSNRGTVDQMKTHVESSMSPISSEGPTPEPPKEKPDESEVTDDHGSEKFQPGRKDHSDDDDESKGGTSFDNVSGNSQAYSTKASACSESKDSKSNPSDKSTKSEGSKERHQSSSSRRDSHHSVKKDIEKDRKSSHSASSQHSSTKEDTKSSRHKTSHDGDKSRHSHSKRHKHDKDREKRRSSSKTEYDEKDEGSRRSDKHQDRKLDKESKREMEKKREQKLKTFEEKVNQTYKLKSDKYEAIDMFAPKQTKNPTFPSPKTSSSTGKSLSPVSTAMRSQSVPSSGLTIASEHQHTPSVFALSSNTSKDKGFDKRKGEQEKIDVPTLVANNEIANKYDRKKLDRIKEQIKKEREHNIISASPKNFNKDDSDSNEKARKIFPELPVSKCDGDKIEQHKDDYVVTKRRLEEARERKMADAHRKKEIDKARRKSHSGTLSNSSSGEMLNITLSSNSKNIRNDTSAADMEIKMMAERRRKEKKKETKDRKKRDKDKLDHRERAKESRDSDNESSEFAMTPTKKAGKRKFSSKDSDGSSSSDNEWKKCGLKESECASITRERRIRKPTNKYNSSDYNTEDSWEENDATETTTIETTEEVSKNFFDIKLESELSKKVEVIMSTDVETEPFNGFGDEKPEKEIKTMYEKHISDAENDVDFRYSDNECKIIDSSIPENFYEQNDFLYISELNAKSGIPKEWSGAKKVATLLRNKFGGNPTVVHPLPRWLSLKLDRWGLRRHEVNIVTAASKLKNNHVYKEDEIDNQYPANQNMQNRFKRLTLMSNHLTKNENSFAQNMPVSASSAIIKRRRDTIEKNLDEMFSSDQENDSDSNSNERKKARIEINESKGIDNLVLSSSIHEPFHGFQENETAISPQFDEATTQISEEKSASGRTVLSNLKAKLIQVDSNGNTFGMDSVLASPISDFNSDYDDDDEFLHPSLAEEIDNKPTDERLPMSVEMNYPMVQYLRRALKNEKAAVQELNRLLGLPNSISPDCDKSDNYLQVEKSIDRFTELNSLVKQAKQNESDGMSKHFLHSKDKDSSDTPVASYGIHVLPPSPISNSDSLSSNEESRILID